MTSNYRSIGQHETDEQLAEALRTRSFTNSGTRDSVPLGESSIETEPSNISSPSVCSELEWTVNPYDSNVTETQSMREELKRLQLVKKYMIMDADREEELERLTRMAARIFNVPTSDINVGDNDRFFMLATHNQPLNVRESARKESMCSHAVWIKRKETQRKLSAESEPIEANPLLIVPDASVDFRFRNNASVKGPPYVRFYAGVQLVSPEGYVIGTLFVVDYKARPGGLSESEQKTLIDLGHMAMKFISNRRCRIEALERRSEQLVASASISHELMTPLTGIELSMCLLNDDHEVKHILGDHRMKILSTAASCSEIVSRICQSSFDRIRKENLNGKICVNQEIRESSSLTPIVDLVKSLQIVTDTMTSEFPISICLHKNVPSIVKIDEIKVLRSVFNLVKLAVVHATSGNIVLRISTQNGTEYGLNPTNLKSSMLTFECEHIGKFIGYNKSSFQSFCCKSKGFAKCMPIGLRSVGLLVNSMNGFYGFRSLKIEESMEDTDEDYVLWFSIPLLSVDNQSALRIPCVNPLVEVEQHSEENLSNTSIRVEIDNRTVTREVDECQKVKALSSKSIDKLSGFVLDNIFGKSTVKRNKYEFEDSISHSLLKRNRYASAPALESRIDSKNVVSLHNFDWSTESNKNYESSLSMRGTKRNGYQSNERGQSKHFRFA